jgi:hypothetical protein
MAAHWKSASTHAAEVLEYESGRRVAIARVHVFESLNFAHLEPDREVQPGAYVLRFDGIEGDTYRTVELSSYRGTARMAAKWSDPRPLLAGDSEAATAARPW